MITDAIISFGVAIWNFIISPLPAGSDVTIPGIGTLTLWLARLDSFLPVAGPLTLMLGILSVVAVFMAVRLVITAINVVKP